jgi:hypothetical protein
MKNRESRRRRPALELMEGRLAPSGGPGPSGHDPVDIDPGHHGNPGGHDVVDNDPGDDDAQDAAEHHRGR